MFVDLIYLVFGCNPVFIAQNLRGFVLALLIGTALAALCWFVCAIYTQLWNKLFRVEPLHHILCAIAALLTLLFTVQFASVAYLEDTAQLSIRIWEAQLNIDPVWGAATFAKAWEAVKDSGLEDFSKVGAPGSGNELIPTSSDETRRMVAGIYANEACKNFDRARPFLSKVVWSAPGVPSEVIFDDVRTVQQTMPQYPATRAIGIAANQIRQGLEPQTPRLVLTIRLVLFLMFLLAQAIPFGLIGWAAYRDINPRV